MTLYKFVRNNSQNFIDPAGLTASQYNVSNSSLNHSKSALPDISYNFTTIITQRINNKVISTLDLIPDPGVASDIGGDGTAGSRSIGIGY